MRTASFALCLSLLGLPSLLATADDAALAPTRQELLSPDWIETTLAEVGIDRLIKLYDGEDGAFDGDSVVQLVQDALILSRTFLSEHPEELRSQLQARLLSHDEPELQVFQELPADRVRARMTRPSLIQAGDALRGVIPIEEQGGAIVSSPNGEFFALRGVRTKAAPPYERLQGLEVRSGLTGELIRFIALDDGSYILPAGISPDCSKVFGITENGLFHAWDLHTGAELWSGLCGFSQDQRLGACAYSPDGRLVAVSPWLPQIVVFEIVTGEEIAVLQADGARMFGDVAFLDDDTLVGSSSDGVLRHWSISSTDMIEELEIGRSRLSRDGTRTMTFDAKSDELGYRVHGIDVLDTTTGESLLHVDLKTPMPLHCAGFDLTSEHALICTFPPNCRLLGYSLRTGEQTLDIEVPSFLCFAPLSGNRIVSSMFDKEICLWDLGYPRLDSMPNDYARHAAITSDGATVMTDHWHWVSLWDTSTWQRTETFTLAEGSTRFTMSDDGSRIAYLLNNEIHSLDPATGQSTLVRKFEPDTRVEAFDLSGDGQIAAISILRDKTYLIDMSNGNVLLSSDPERYLSLSYDGSRLLLSRRLADRSDDSEIEFDQVFGGVSAISADGNLGIINGPLNGNVVWNLDTGEIIKDAAHVEDVDWLTSNDTPVAISGNGRFSVSCGFDQHVYLYDIAEQQQLTVVATDAPTIKSLEISDNGEDLLILIGRGTWHHVRFENLPP